MSLANQAMALLQANNYALVTEILGKSARSFKVSEPLGRYEMLNMLGTEGVATFEGGAVKFVGEDFCLVREGRTKVITVIGNRNLPEKFRKIGAKVPAFKFAPSVGVRRALEAGLGEPLEQDKVEQEDGFAFRTRTISLRSTEHNMAHYIKEAIKRTAERTGERENKALNLEVLLTGVDPMLSSMSGGEKSGARALFDLAATRIKFEFSNIVADDSGEPTYDFEFSMVLQRDDWTASISLDRGADAWILDYIDSDGHGECVYGLYADEPLLKLLEMVGPGAVQVGVEHSLVDPV